MGGVSNSNSNSSSSSNGGRVRPLFQGIILGVGLGLLYSLVVWLMGRQIHIPFLDLSGSARGNPAAGERNWVWASQDGPPVSSEMRQIRWLMAVWEASPMLKLRKHHGKAAFMQRARDVLRNVSLGAPHLENCQGRAEEFRRLDSRLADGSRPAWSLWKGQIGLLERESHVEVETSEEVLGNKTALVWGPFPPWVEGADEDNLPMTRRAQRDIWLLQHPPDCNDPDIRFLAPHWSSYEHYGLGAQIHHMTGLFAIAMRERRVLVMQDFNRAGHKRCQGLQWRRWSCYFLPETTLQCRIRAEQLLNDPRAVAQGRVWLEEHIPSSYNVWMGEPPDLWGKPWDLMQPTLEIEGQLYTRLHNFRDVRWWRSQALRYLMRFPTEYTCMLMNKARHDAFGLKAATKVVRAASETAGVEEGDMEKWVWKSQKPWVPRPLVNVHVRIGDKGSEMKLVGFDGYMLLAKRLQRRFPHVHHIWLSTEMQDVVDASKNYTSWNFYYTNVSRQTGSSTMASYLQSLGTEAASTNSFVNFLMAVDSDYFIGALGSTWCYLIDAMRATGGKQMSGYLSVNVDRFWKRRKMLSLPPPVAGHHPAVPFLFH